ncbi:unnamed protein product [Euphydryas editha]|uniref:Rhythmically expressed gene 2 protein-like n=1 Tax=Euphydryas editha TaxID=104508 RepID=A0AAU9UXE1_EUPED|nr:unnamed protein product [Euphydryas editha]
MPLTGIKLVTFDVTNTLLKFRKAPWDYYANVAKKSGFNGNGISIKNKLLNNYSIMTKQYPNFGKDSISWQQWWSKIIEMTFQGELPTDANISMISNKLIDDYKTPICWKLADGSEDLIRLLSQSNISIGVISNFDPRLHEILLNLNINKYFEFILTSYEVGFCKPDKRIFEIAQAKCKHYNKPLECLHIGDDISKDYEGAKKAGWHALLVTNKLNSIKPQVLSNSFSNLKDLCSSIENKKLNLSC